MFLLPNNFLSLCFLLQEESISSTKEVLLMEMGKGVKLASRILTLLLSKFGLAELN